MKPLQDYLEDRFKLTEDQFLSRHAAPVLVHRLRQSSGPELSSATVVAPGATSGPQHLGDVMLSMSVANTRALVHMSRVMAKLGGQPDAAQGQVVVFALRPRNARDEVSLGRDASADVVLPFPKISKVHARVARRDGGYHLCDVGSRNGTRLNGTAIGAGSLVPLGNETSIHLSEYQFLFYDPQGFYRLLGGG